MTVGATTGVCLRVTGGGLAMMRGAGVRLRVAVKLGVLVEVEAAVGVNVAISGVRDILDVEVAGGGGDG